MVHNAFIRVISFVYEFFPGLGSVSNTFKYEEYGKVIGYVSFYNTCFEFSIYYWDSDDMINCTRCVPCTTWWFFTVGIRPCRKTKFIKLWTILLSLKSRTLILKSPTKITSLLLNSVFERIFLKWFSSSFGSPFEGQ